ncbi:MAG: ketopantoate reductase family protein [Vicinamibacterales bacterium]
MTFAIVGAGAIGAYLGARLARAGADVVLVARGPHAAAMRERGIRVRSIDGDFEIAPPIADTLDAVGAADVVILGVKAHSLPAIAPQLPRVLHAGSIVVSTQNGIPWWYFQNCGGALEGLRLDRLDPDGAVASAIEPSRVIGMLVYLSADVPEPGVIHHTHGQRIVLGEPSGERTDRIKHLSEAFVRAGFRAPVTTRIREEIWVKLLGNVAFNPVSALTGSTLEALAQDADSSRLLRDVMTEAAEVATRLGLDLPISIEQRLAGAGRVGAHKTSMLQDREAGRPMEVEAIVGAVVEIGERLGVPMPATRAVYACVKQLDSRLAADRLSHARTRTA